MKVSKPPPQTVTVHIPQASRACVHSGAKTGRRSLPCKPAEQAAAKRLHQQTSRYSLPGNSSKGTHAHVLLAATTALICGGYQIPALAVLQAEAGKYQPTPYSPGWEIWVGAVAATIPFAIGSWEFGKRILIQRRCRRCEGSGLVTRRRFMKKCPECGGFFPWQGWGRFFAATAAPGNGGVLRAPRGQSSIFYRVPEQSSEQQGTLQEETGNKDSSKEKQGSKN